ncbi:MAG: hypothetical protein V5789_02380 [Colwellia sp.]
MKDMLEGEITELSENILFLLIKVLKWKDPINNEKYLDDINQLIFAVQHYPTKVKKRSIDYAKWMITDWLVSENHFNKLFNRQFKSYLNLPEILSNSDCYTKINSLAPLIACDVVLNKFEDIRDYL